MTANTPADLTSAPSYAPAAVISLISRAVIKPGLVCNFSSADEFGDRISEDLVLTNPSQRFAPSKSSSGGLPACHEEDQGRCSWSPWRIKSEAQRKLVTKVVRFHLVLPVHTGKNLRFA
jgi:hypothetical protein